ncbi:MAG: hypothetical protein SFW62_00340 [Alphaproteobacteria bacterium]|nr:hypothetical protein [Alphaproteobacteria bacterium]
MDFALLSRVSPDFRDLHSVVRALHNGQLDSVQIREAFEKAMQASLYKRTGIDPRPLLGPCGWNSYMAEDFCALMHVASCYDKRFQQHGDQGLTARLISSLPLGLYHKKEDKVAHAEHVQKLAKVGLEPAPLVHLLDVLFNEPDPSQMGAFVNFALAVTGVPCLDHIIETSHYEEFFKVIDGWERQSLMDPWVADTYRILAVFTAEQSGKLPSHLHFQTPFVAIELECAAGSIFVARRDNGVKYNLYMCNEYTECSDSGRWGKSPTLSMELIDDGFFLLHTEERKAVVEGFKKLFDKIEQTGGAGLFYLQDERKKWEEYMLVRRPTFFPQGTSPSNTGLRNG